AFALGRRRDRVGRPGRGVGRVPSPALDGPGDRRLLAVGPVQGEFLAGQVHDDLADVEFHATEDVRDFGAGRDLSAFRVEVQRRVDDDVAEVERAGHRRGDEDDRERCPLIRTGEVDLAFELQRFGAGARLDRGDADLAFLGAARLFRLSRAGLTFGRRIFLRLAVRDA